MTAPVDTVTSPVALPEGASPFGTGPVFEVVVRSDVETFHGNVQVSAGRYQAQQSTHGDEGDITLWSPNYYARGDRDGGWVSLPPWSWTFPGEASRALPEHVCADEARSAVSGSDVYCGICHAALL